ncbi:MAG: hypothetical protein OXC06_16625 [Acidimicrobiaceae bacterium]|nr:hypothetical protein [Acidimicrobiaceae bacterium]
MTKYRFTLEAVGPEYSDEAFSEWVASRAGASGHATRNGHHYIHFDRPAASLDLAVKDAAGELAGWNGLQVVGFSSPCSNSGVLARA